MQLLPLSKIYYQTNMKICYTILGFVGKEKWESIGDLFCWRLDFEGEILYFTETEDGGYRLSGYNENFSKQVVEAEKIMQQDKDLLRELSKRWTIPGSNLKQFL